MKKINIIKKFKKIEVQKPRLKILNLNSELIIDPQLNKILNLKNYFLRNKKKIDNLVKKILN